MSKIEKSIDGLVVRSSKANGRKIGELPPSPKKTKKAKRSKKIEVEEAPGELSSEEITEEFLKPVEAFDFDLTNKDLKEELEKIKKQEKAKRKLKIKKKKQPGKTRKVVAGIALGIVLLLMGGVVWVSIWGNDLIARITSGRSNLWDAIGVLTQEKTPPLKADVNGRTNILVFGTSGYDMSGNIGKGSKHDGASLTDSIMVVSINQETGDTAMISLPRDLKVRSTCGTVKINAFYSCGSKNKDGQAGAKALMTQVSEVLGIELQYYVHINWSSLINIVDALGGITVTLDNDINDRYYTKTVIKAGVPTHLDGEQALGLARARHGTLLGDWERGHSQQKILMAIERKVLEKAWGLAEILNMVNILGDNLRSDFSLDEMKTGAKLVKVMDLNEMRQVLLADGTNKINYIRNVNINEVSYVIPTAGDGNYQKIQEYVAKMLDNDPLKRESAKILVLNGTGETGVAGAEKDKLENDGYTVSGVANAPEGGEYPEMFYLYVVNEESYGSMKKLENYYNTTARSAGELPAGVDTTDCDFVVIVGERRKESLDN